MPASLHPTPNAVAHRIGADLKASASTCRAMRVTDLILAVAARPGGGAWSLSAPQGADVTVLAQGAWPDLPLGAWDTPINDLERVLAQVHDVCGDDIRLCIGADVSGTGTTPLARWVANLRGRYSRTSRAFELTLLANAACRSLADQISQSPRSCTPTGPRPVPATRAGPPG